MKLSKIKEVIEIVKELPTLSIVANKVNALLSNPASSARDLADIIEKDQSIAAKILKLVNSAQYNLPQGVTNIAQAIALLGYKNISYIVMTLSVFDTLRNVKEGRFDRTQFWLHSIATAFMSMKIADECKHNFFEDIFTAGLLHDIGKVFMDGYLHEEFIEIVRIADKKNISFYDAERLLYDVDHALVGEWIARTWKLPLHIVAGIKHHHQEVEERRGLSLSSGLFIDFIRLADISVTIRHFGENGDGKNYHPVLNRELFKRLPLDEGDVLKLLDALEDDMKESETLLTLAI